mmetsp:Transcript_7023/g.13013  ORF Transcript_7023/g.13013 Transcript_7023/m.13013 type:complete len:347 (-) Transcript_7023:95-1135(-)
MATLLEQTWPAARPLLLKFDPKLPLPHKALPAVATVHGRCHSGLMVSAALRFDSACSFLFSDATDVNSNTVCRVREVSVHGMKEECGVTQHKDVLEAHQHHGAQRRPVVDALKLPPPNVGNVAIALVPTIAAVLHPAGLSATGAVVPAMMPVVVPYSMPHVSSDIWLGNKRARAYHRCCVLAVYAQGTVALVKFISGDVVAGLFYALQAAIGAAATKPEGSKLMQTYAMVAGFNGVLGFIQALQSYQGALVPNLPLFLAPSVISVLAAYCGWQFCKEIRAIASGYTGTASQNSCFVRIFSADCWPLASLSPLPRDAQHFHAPSSEEPEVRQSFEPFGGRGQRLVET